VRVNDVSSGSASEQCADLVGLVCGERQDGAAAEEPTKLDLPSGTADLRDDRCRGDRDHAEFQTRPVLAPDRALVAISGDQNARVVDEAHGSCWRT